MEVFDVDDAQAHLPHILARVQAGEEILIAKAGAPVARIVPVQTRKPRIPGRDRGRIWVADDFDAPLPDHLMDFFEGRS